MKKIIGFLLLTLSLSAFPQHHGHKNNYNHYHNHGHRYNWVVPAVIGGLVVYGATRQPQNPVIVEQYPYPQQTQNCSEWREIYVNGVRYLERTCFSR